MSSLQKLAGFKESLNWKLYLALSIPWALFLIFTIPKIDIDRVYCAGTEASNPFHAAPGECYWYMMSSRPRYHLGIAMHLAGVTPAGLLAIAQFTPALRTRFPAAHRRLGYASTASVLVGVVGAALIADQSFGGDVATQTFAYFLTLISTYSLWRAIATARARKFAAHRAWMIRTWGYFGVVLSMRPMMFACAFALATLPVKAQHAVMLCGEIKDMLNGDEATMYRMWPACDPGAAAFNPNTLAIVKADVLAGNDVQAMAAMRLGFGPMGCLAIAIHIIVVEWYLNRKPKPTRERVTANGSTVEARQLKVQ